MVKGTMKWTSTTKEFGLLTPDDGGCDVFVRFSSAIAALCTSDSHGEAVPVKDLVAPIHRDTSWRRESKSALDISPGTGHVGTRSLR